jgi:hypothetical protein
MPRSDALLSLLLAVFPVVAFAEAPVKELAADETTWRSRMQPGSTIEIKGGLGDVTVTRSENDEVLLEIVRGNEGTVAPRVVVAEDAKRVKICGDWTTKPGTPSPCSKTKKKLADGSLKNYSSVDLRIAVPDGVNVDVQTSKGDITVGPLNTAVNADTHIGNVRISSTGARIKADNTEGEITLDLVPDLIKQSVHLSTTRGRIRLGIPESRLVKLDLYPRGALVRSHYDLGNGGAWRGDTFEYAGLRTFNATLGPPKEKTWTTLEIYALDDIYSEIEIVKP